MRDNVSRFVHITGVVTRLFVIVYVIYTGNTSTSGYVHTAALLAFMMLWMNLGGWLFSW